MTLATALRLGRVSNLPTVWTNALAGTTLRDDGRLLPVIDAALGKREGQQLLLLRGQVSV